MSQVQSEAGRVVVGGHYHYRPLSPVRRHGQVSWEPVPQGRYVVRGLAWDAVHLRESVVYEGLTGPDRGEWYVCSPSDFMRKFRPVPPPPAPPEKAAGTADAGKGY